MSHPVNVARPGRLRDLEGLRASLGLFSFQGSSRGKESDLAPRLSSQLGIRPGGIVEWLVETDGSGALVLAKYLVSQSQGGGSVVAVVDPLGECYLPAFTGWGLDARRLLVVHPETLQETSWGVEQCLRCEGIKATLAWVDRRIHERVHRRWQLAAEAGGGIGMFFRPVETRREPVWADLRLLVRPLVKGEGEIRRIHVEVLYRRGGLGGSAQVWEIDHAAGFVRLVPPVANSAQASRAPRSQTG